MIRRFPFLEEVNFKNGKTSETSNAIALAIRRKLHVFRNPYIGNKRKLIPFLIQTIDKYNINYKSILDLFCGSAFVSMAMKLLNKKVICNDILESAYINAVAFVANNNIVLTKEEKKYLIENIRKSEPKSIFDNYRDRFTDNEIKKINDYRLNIDDLFNPNLSDGLTMMKNTLSLAYLQNYIMEHCFIGGRLNNGQVLAKLEHRLNHPRNRGKEMTFKNIRWTKPIYPNDPNHHSVYRLDAIDLLERLEEFKKYDGEIDLCYMDPPYGGEQSNYVQMYNFFETLQFLYPKTLRDHIPERFNEQIKEDIRKRKEGEKRFINNKNYEKHFDKLMDLSRKIPWIIISYNNTSWGDIDRICSIIKKYRKEIIIEEFDYSYNYRNKDKNIKDTKEYLILSKV